MLPDSTLSTASFSFWVRTGQPAALPESEPPSPHVLHSAGTRRPASGASHPAPLLTLPTMLIHLIRSWLIDAESMQLILTSQHLQREVQQYYRQRLRLIVAGDAVSPIAHCQNTVNLKPSYVPLGIDGELIFQKCKALQTPGLSEAQYRSKVLHFLKFLVVGKQDFYKLRDMVTGVTLTLGGTFMSVANRDALLAEILGSCKTSGPNKMGAMIWGFCIGLRRTVAGLKHHEALLTQILSSGKTCSPDQMGAMIEVICRVFGGEKMRPKQRNGLINRIFATYPTGSPSQISAMLAHVGRAFGGTNITPDHRDGLLQQILTAYDKDSDMPLARMFSGASRGFGGPEMTDANLDAVLVAIVGGHSRWNKTEMAHASYALCAELGGPTMSQGHRDTVLAKMLGSAPLRNPDQMGGMFFGLCRALNSLNQGASNMTTDNLDAILRQVLQFHGTTNHFQTGAIIYCIYCALGSTNITASHRDILLAHLQGSKHRIEILVGIVWSSGGQLMLDFLQLKIPDPLASFLRNG